MIAHRGDSAHAPENTLEAARKAHEAGADAWELDVQLSGDGVAVVVHDETLERTTDVARRFEGDPRGLEGWRVGDFDASEIGRLDAGSWFVDPRGGPRSAEEFGTAASLAIEDRARYGSGAIGVPSLVEALEWTVGRDWAVNVELKPSDAADPALTRAVLDAIDAAGAADRVLISSFDHEAAGAIAGRRPDLATAVLATSPIARPAEYCRGWVGVDAYHTSTLGVGAESSSYRRRPSPGNLRLEDIKAARASGVLFSVYTVNDVRLARDLAAAGISGLFTDDPAKILAGLDRGGS